VNHFEEKSASISIIRSKRQMYDLLRRGRLGNHGLMWETVDEWFASGYDGLIAIRTRSPLGRCDYNLPPADVLPAFRSFLNQGYKEEDLHFSAMAPERHCVLRGEVGRVSWPHGELELHYARDRHLSMRDSLRQNGQYASGLEALSILQAALWPQSYDMVMEVVEEYPDHGVEFTAFSKAWGVLPHHNCVVWEVRLY